MTVGTIIKGSDDNGSSEISRGRLQVLKGTPFWRSFQLRKNQTLALLLVQRKVANARKEMQAFFDKHLTSWENVDSLSASARATACSCKLLMPHM